MLDLCLVGPTLAYDGLFYLPGGILMDSEPTVSGRYNCRPSRLSQLQRRIRVAGHENLLNGEFSGAVFADERCQTMEDGLQAFRHGLLTHPDTTTVNVLNHTAFSPYNAVTGYARPGVDPMIIDTLRPY